MMPGKPRDKVLFIVGREGIGKGVVDRIMEGLLPEGKGAIDLNKLLTADRFQFSGLDGHVLLTDPEIDRKFRKDAKLSTRNFNTLFGSDTTFNERKFHEGKKQIYYAKGIFMGNLPLFRLHDMAAFRRILLVQTLTDRTTSDDPNVHSKILENERDIVTTLLIRYLKILKDCGWGFVNELTKELTKESTAELWAQFADPVENFELEYLTEAQGPESEIKVDDLYEFFKNEYCKPKGITPVPKQTFTSRIAETYIKMRRGPKGKRHYAFVNIFCDGLSTFDGKNEEGSQVGHRQNDIKIHKTTVSRAKRYGVQLEYVSLAKGAGVKGKRIPFYSSLDKGWTPCGNGSPVPKTTAPEEKKAVSNLKNGPENDKPDPQFDDTPDGNPAPKNDTGVSQNQKDRHMGTENPITVENGNSDHDSLPEKPKINADPVNNGVQKEIKENSPDMRYYQFKENPRKAIFEVVKFEAHKSKYGSFSVKSLFDMIPEPSLSMKAIFDICEGLYNIGALTKTSGGSYRINPEFKEGFLQ